MVRAYLVNVQIYTKINNKTVFVISSSASKSGHLLLR